MTNRYRQIVADGELGPVTTRAVPQPGHGEALLRIHATSVNFHDYVGINGGIPGLPVPRVPFSDAVATIEALGDGVEGWSAGDRVVPSFFPRWRRGRPDREVISLILGDQVDGTLQTHVCVPAESLVAAPAHLSDTEAATLGCAGLTAWRAVMVEGRVAPHHTVVLQGTGGVSLFALTFARMAGARVIVTSSSDEKLARARAMGADDGINYRRTPEWSRAVLDMTDGRGADLVVEVGGGETLAQAVRATRHDGHISVIGVLTGVRSPEFPLNIVMSRNITMRGVTVGSTADLHAMCGAIARHRMQPIVDSVFTLDDAHAAIAALKSLRHFGKIAITIE